MTKKDIERITREDFQGNVFMAKLVANILDGKLSLEILEYDDVLEEIEQTILEIRSV